MKLANPTLLQESLPSRQKSRRVQVGQLPDEKSDSGWFAILEDVPPARKLGGSQSCDWLVLGGGWMGCHAARRLAELRPDDSIALVDAGRIGNNAGGRCAGFAIDLAHNPRQKDFALDLEENKRESQVNRDGIAYIHACAEGLEIDCDLSPEGKIHGAVGMRGAACLKSYADALDRSGEPYEWLDADAMAAVSGSRLYSQGLFAPGATLLQPAAYLSRLSRKLGANVAVYEDSPVTVISYGTPDHICRTPNGEIRAKNVILATNGFITYAGFYAGTAIPLYTFGSLTRVLTAAEQDTLNGRATFGIVPAEPFGTTVRRTADNRLFIRNIYDYAPDFVTSQRRIDSAQASHQRAFEKRYPDLAPMGFEHSWGRRLRSGPERRHGVRRIGEPRLCRRLLQRHRCGARRGLWQGHRRACLWSDRPHCRDFAPPATAKPGPIPAC